MATLRQRPMKLLFLCTGNSARSQMAEAVLNQKAKGRLIAESAGSQPAGRVNPLAIETLRAYEIPWTGHPPRSVYGLEREHWDFVITVCDRARESCPIFPGQPILAHWGMPDPAAVVGDEATRRAAFRDTLILLSRRIDLMLSLPFDSLERLALEARVRAIGQGDVATVAPRDSGSALGQSVVEERHRGLAVRMRGEQ